MKTLKTHILTTALITLISIVNVSAKNYYTSSDGKWSKNSTWVNNDAPGTWFGSNDTVFVDHNIDYDRNVGFSGVMVISSSGSIIGNKNLSVNSNGQIIADGDIKVKKLNIWGGSIVSTVNVEATNGLDTSPNTTIDIDGDFVSGNHVTLNNVALDVDGDFLIDGKLNMNSNSTADVSGNVEVTNKLELNNSSILTIHGSSDFDNHVTLNFNSELETDGASSIDGKLKMNGGNLIIGDNFIISGKATVNSGSKITNDGHLITNGELILNSSGAEIDNNGTITSNSTVSSGGTITNDGTWNANDELTNSWGGVYINNGNIYATDDIVNQGLLINNNYLETTGGDLKNDWSSSFVNDGSSFIDGDIDNNGTMSGSGSTLITGTLDSSDGDVTGSGYVCNPDNITDPTGGNQTNVDPSVQICGQTDSDPFPVELVDFTADNNGQAVELSWTTASELNNDYFTVERSIDGGEFENIATVQGAGNSNEIINYSYVDYNSPKGQSVYYRIKQTDFDGTVSYSWILDVYNKQEIVAKVYPNPAQSGEIITIQSSVENVEVSLFNAQGVMILTKELNQNQFDMYTDNLKPGMYFVTIKSSDSSESVTKKLVIR